MRSRSPDQARTSPSSSVAPTFRFFGGKGGVGKTTCAAATALAHALHGRRVIVISTDPAHSLADALGRKLTSRPTAVPVPARRRGAAILHALHLDADRVLDRWLRDHRTRLVSVGERGTYLDRSDIEGLMDVSLPGVSELFALREVVRIAHAGRYDETIVDTAPTGHTLRLLATPAALARVATILDDFQAKHRALVQAINRRYRADANDLFVKDLAVEAEQLEALLRDGARVRFTLVTIPEAVAVAETRDALDALASAGIAVDTLIVNRVSPSDSGCRMCRDRRRVETAAIRTLSAEAVGQRISLRRAPLLAEEPIGVKALGALGRILEGHEHTALALRGKTASRPRPSVGRSRSAALRAWLAAPPRLTFVMGKGGVGKTTCASALALAIAARHRKRRVLLLSIDPAHSIGDVLERAISNDTTRIEPTRGLFARELDATHEFQRAAGQYRTAVDELFAAIAGGSNLDASYDHQIARDLIDLAPPGLDELIALLTIVDLTADMTSDAMSSTHFHHVVIDTAPTGHAIRLFEMRRQAHEWVRALMGVLLKYGAVVRPGAVAEQLVRFSRGLRALDAVLERGTDTAIVPVTRAAVLPRAETLRLVSSLAELELPRPAFVVVNAVSSLDVASCHGCRSRARADAAEIRRLAGALRGCAIILAPALAEPPRGANALNRWIDRWQDA
jgi:arsenite-transporting ATPase